MVTILEPVRLAVDPDRHMKVATVEVKIGNTSLELPALVSPGHALAWRGPMATGALANLVDAEWGDAELILVDLPPGTGDVQLSLIQRSRPAGASCRGSSSTPTAARSFRRAAGRVATTPDRDCHR